MRTVLASMAVVLLLAPLAAHAQDSHEINRAYFERALAAPATVRSDHMAKSGRKPVVEGVRDKRVLSDSTRTVEIHQFGGNPHDDGLLMVYLPKEKLLSVDRLLPLHGRLVPIADLHAAVGQGH